MYNPSFGWCSRSRGLVEFLCLHHERCLVAIGGQEECDKLYKPRFSTGVPELDVFCRFDFSRQVDLHPMIAEFSAPATNWLYSRDGQSCAQAVSDIPWICFLLDVLHSLSKLTFTSGLLGSVIFESFGLRVRWGCGFIYVDVACGKAGASALLLCRVTTMNAAVVGSRGLNSEIWSLIEWWPSHGHVC